MKGIIILSLFAAIGAFAQPATRFPDIVKDEILQLEDNITLKTWRQQHPADSVVSFNYSEEEVDNKEWVCRADKFFQLPGTPQVAVRRAYFYAPLPPENLDLPTLADSLNTRNDDPILGMIRVEMIDRSSQYGGIMADSVIEKINGVIGMGDRGAKLWGYGAAGWSHTCRWQVDDKIFASGYGITRTIDELPTVSAFGFLPISNVHVDFDCKDFSVGGKDLDEDSIVFQRSFQYLGQYKKDAAPLLHLYSKNEKDSLNLKTTLNIFRGWFDIFKNVDNRQRACAFIVADHVLQKLETAFIEKCM